VEARKNLADERFPDRGKITLKEGEALEILKEMAEADEKYDFIFLDAAKGQYMNFLPELMKLIVPEGLLITDNVLQDGTVINSKYSITRRDRTIHMRMREYLYAITHMDELETLILPIGDGIAVSYRKPI
jgi:predicted O-methyltransferase YrrM